MPQKSTADMLSERLEKLKNEYFENRCNEKVRNELQHIFDAVNSEYCENPENPSLTVVTREALSLLRNVYNTGEVSEKAIYRCNLTDLFGNLTFCCDLLCGSRGKRVFFNSDVSDYFTACNPSAMSWAFLNLLENAVAYSSGSYVSVSQSVLNERCLIIIESEGTFDCNDYFEAVKRNGGGISCAEKIISALGGSMFMSSFYDMSCVCFTIPKADTTGLCSYCAAPVEELLCDRLSVVYTALCRL